MIAQVECTYEQNLKVKSTKGLNFDISLVAPNLKEEHSRSRYWVNGVILVEI